MKRKKEALTRDSEITREEAEWMAGVEEKTGRLMVEYLKASTDVRKPIDSLSKVHLSALAEIARAEWVNSIAERKTKLKDGPMSAGMSRQMEMLLI